MSGRLIFLDTETTGLDPRVHRIWDLAYIIRDPGKPDRERQWFLDVPLDRADPFALKVGRYWQRHPQPYGPDFNGPLSKITGSSEFDIADQVAKDLQDAIVVGACPWFDDAMLKALLFRQRLMPTWHYHLVDVETLAAGQKCLQPPWDFDRVLAAYELTYDEAERHAALGDARMARDLYDAVLRSDAPTAGDKP